MCYNCGCGNPNDDMGDPRNITNKTFADASEAEKQSIADAMQNTADLLKKEIEKSKNK